MSILYSKVQRVNPNDVTGPRKWYIIPNRVELKGDKEVAEALAKNTTLSRGEAWMVLDELQSVMIRFLLDGYSVQMAEWGSFRLTLNCSGAESEDSCTPANVQSINIRFTPGKAIKKELSKATFVER